jgi:hypothetical protein
MNCGSGIGEGRERSIIDVNMFNGGSCLLTCLGDDDGENVACVGRSTADGDHHWPVLVNDPDHRFAGYVSGREHGNDSGLSERLVGSDSDDVGSSVSSEDKCGMEHAGQSNVIYISTVTKGELGGFVLRGSRANGTKRYRSRGGLLGYRFNRVENLGVTGASTEVGTEVSSHVGSCEIGTLLFNLGMSSNDDPRNAKATLQSTAGCEGLREAIADLGIESFQRGDRSTCNLGQVSLATYDRLAVHEDGATPTLAARRTAILWGGDV